MSDFNDIERIEESGDFGHDQMERYVERDLIRMLGIVARELRQIRMVLMRREEKPGQLWGLWGVRSIVGNTWMSIDQRGRVGGTREEAERVKDECVKALPGDSFLVQEYK